MDTTKIIGVDFTSRPSRRKPIVAAHSRLTGSKVWVEDLQSLPDFSTFEALLAEPGPWIAGLDFPFGLPRRFLTNIGWTGTWTEYVTSITKLGEVGFEELLTEYKRPRPFGDKEHQRATDKPVGARSPMKLFNPPVGKMFFQGATRLVSSGASILPCRPSQSNCIVVETYPAVVAHFLIEKRPYKNDAKKKQNADQQAAREAIVDGFESARFRDDYRIEVAMSAQVASRVIDDASGDSMDAVLAAIQVAGAFFNYGLTFGIPASVDAGEGWIVGTG